MILYIIVLFINVLRLILQMIKLVQMKYQTKYAANPRNEIRLKAKTSSDNLSNARIQRNELIASAYMMAEASKPSSTFLLRQSFGQNVILYGYIMVSVALY